jgi:uncharacterized membrane protein YqjE
MTIILIIIAVAVLWLYAIVFKIWRILNIIHPELKPAMDATKKELGPAWIAIFKYAKEKKK